MEDSASSHIRAMLGVNIAFGALGTAMFLARAYSRAILVRVWHPEDTTLAIAWIFTLTHLALVFAGISVGDGRHIWTVPPHDVVTALKLHMGYFTAYTLATLLMKISLCLFYIRIFQKKFAIIPCMVLVVLNALTYFLLLLLGCRPFSAWWTLPSSFPVGAGRPCIDFMKPFYTLSSCTILVDLWLMAVILPRISTMKIHWREKALLIGLVSLGLVVAGLSAIRIGMMPSLTSFDVTHIVYTGTILSSLDMNIGLFAVSAPFIRPLLRKSFPRLSGWIHPPTTEPVIELAIQPHGDHMDSRDPFQQGSTRNDTFCTVAPEKSETKAPTDTTLSKETIE